MFRRILVVCIGNICRSPMCEALLAERMKKISPETSVSSAGVAALVGMPADSVAQELMRERGLDISNHRARQLTQEIVFDIDLILTMDTRQQEQIEYMIPAARGRVHRLGKWGGFDIQDPYKRPKLVFEQALALIELGIDEWQSKIWK